MAVFGQALHLLKKSFVYFLVASTHGFYWPIILYAAFAVIASGFVPRNLLAIFLLHGSYTAGLIVGLFRRHSSWM